MAERYTALTRFCKGGFLETTGREADELSFSTQCSGVLPGTQDLLTSEALPEGPSSEGHEQDSRRPGNSAPTLGCVCPALGQNFKTQRVIAQIL